MSVLLLWAIKSEVRLQPLDGNTELKITAELLFEVPSLTPVSLLLKFSISNYCCLSVSEFQASQYININGPSYNLHKSVLIVSQKKKIINESCKKVRYWHINPSALLIYDLQLFV